MVTVAYCALVLGVLTAGSSAAVQSAREFPTYSTHPCQRKCEGGERPMYCEYDFTLEYYHVLSKACYDCPRNRSDCYRPHCVPADGTGRAIIVVNRMLPGPSIQVCQGDVIRVRVHNELTGGEGTSIHWHGIRQRGSQLMDGVSMVTQCPIPAFSSFEYTFTADDAGTHYWHAHSGMQRSDGVFGALVVRQTDAREPHVGLYEDDLPEHVMHVQDWLVDLGLSRFAKHHHAGRDSTPLSMLINGLGALQEFVDSTDNTSSHTPVHVFHVTRGTRYRFRVISNGIRMCPIQISIDDHNLTMIASDGNAFGAVPEVESFMISGGERFDFVVNANMAVGNFWIRARGHLVCGFKKSKQVAILRYDGAPEEDPPGETTWDNAERQGKLFNPFNERSSEMLITLSDLVARQPVSDDPALRQTPDKRFYLTMDFNKINNYHYHDEEYYPISAVERPMQLFLPQINHISTIRPSSPPLTQLDDLDQSIFCNHMDVGGVNCSATYCECVYRLQVALGDVVELVVIDEGVTYNVNHPMHLHGYHFYVVGMDRLGVSTSLEEVQRLDDQGELPRNLDSPVLKDTVTVPDGGYTILRFHADNPGFWFFHCHNQFHMDLGMGLFIQVGGKKDFPKVPRGFPRCGSWKSSPPNGDDDEDKKCTGTAALSFSVSKSGLVCVGVIMLMLTLFDY